MPDIEIFSPSTPGKPRGHYSQIASARAERTCFIAGQLAAKAAGEIIGEGDFDAQCMQVFENVRTALEACGLGWRISCSSRHISLTLATFRNSWPSARGCSRYFSLAANTRPTRFLLCRGWWRRRFWCKYSRSRWAECPRDGR